jgi:transcriptional regulator with XRE-family HTH domain
MKNKKSKIIFNNLRRYRKVRGLTQKQVAEILELNSTAMISRWETGLCLPDTMNLIRLTVVYRSSLDGLFMEFAKEIRKDLIQKEEKIFKNATDASGK